jgi:hypothetical protein
VWRDNPCLEGFFRVLGAKDQALKFPVFVNTFKKFPSNVVSDGGPTVLGWSVAFWVGLVGVSTAFKS